MGRVLHTRGLGLGWLAKHRPTFASHLQPVSQTLGALGQPMGEPLRGPLGERLGEPLRELLGGSLGNPWGNLWGNSKGNFGRTSGGTSGGITGGATGGNPGIPPWRSGGRWKCNPSNSFGSKRVVAVSVVSYYLSSIKSLVNLLSW